MKKLTSGDIALTKIVRATFLNDKWVILVTDTNNYLYNVSFTGLESDDNNTILSNNSKYKYYNIIYFCIFLNVIINLFAFIYLNF